MNANLTAKLGGGDRKWIVVGGSYAGGLAGWFRGKYPNLAFAGWASSGVVYPRQDYFEYDENVYIATNRSENNCTE